MSKLVLVTGAGRGLGRAIALRLAADGFTVAGCARSKSDLEETKALSKGAIKTAQVDVTRLEDVRAWIDGVVAGASQATPWGLVTAAGIHGDIGPFLDADIAEWRQGLEVNLYGTTNACLVFAGILASRKLAGRLVLLSGGGATKPIENMTSYCASKAAVVRFGETLARELETRAITVNAIAPGAVNTALTRTIVDAGADKAGKALFEQTKKQLAEGGASPDKAVALVSYLLGESSAPVTGRLISAIWDDWAVLHKNKALLADRDALTLRRQLFEELNS